MRSKPGKVLVDESAPMRLSDADVRDWAAGRRLFISSPMLDTRDERSAVASAMAAAGATPVWFERFGGRDDDPERAYLSEVDRAEAYFGILRTRYGLASSHGLSATHAEYRRAHAEGKPVAVWVADDVAGQRERSLVEFINEVRRNHTTGTYRAAGDLAEQIAERIGELAADDVSPWLKLGDLVFRASRVALGRDGGRIETRLRSGPILHELTSLVDRYSRSAERLLTVRERSLPVRVTDVSTTVESSARTTVTIEFTLLERPASTRVGYSTGERSYSAEEVVALRLRQQLFGEELLSENFYFWCDFEIDAIALRRADLSESTATALTRLLITEALVGGGYVGAIQRIDVGPLRREGRGVEVQWADAKVYANVEPDHRSVEGVIRY